MVGSRGWQTVFASPTLGFWSKWSLERSRPKKKKQKTKKKNCVLGNKESFFFFSSFLCGYFVCCTHTGVALRQIALGGSIDFGSSLSICSKFVSRSVQLGRRREEGLFCVLTCVIPSVTANVSLLHLPSLAECFCTICRCAIRHGGECRNGPLKKKMMTLISTSTHQSCPLFFLLFLSLVGFYSFFVCVPAAVWCVGRWGRGAGLQVCFLSWFSSRRSGSRAAIWATGVSACAN